MVTCYYSEQEQAKYMKSDQYIYTRKGGCLVIKLVSICMMVLSKVQSDRTDLER